MSDCFVCMSAEPPLYKVCLCDTKIHRTCFERLVNVPSHSTHCAMCKTAYNMKIDFKWQIVYNRSGILFCLTIMSSVLASSFLFTVSYFEKQYNNNLNWALRIISCVFGFISILSGWYVWKVYRRNTGDVCCITVKKNPVRKLLYLNVPDEISRRVESQSCLNENTDKQTSEPV